MRGIDRTHPSFRDSGTGPAAIHRAEAPSISVLPSVALSPAALSIEARRIDLIETAGVAVLRYGLVGLLLLFGSFKFFAFEAVGIQPLVANSPFLGWLYPVLGLQGTSALIGTIELTAGVLIATRPWLPRVSGYASLAGSLTFVVTLSFLFTTPGGLDPMGPAFGFLVKDVVLLGAALLTSAEALRAASDRSV